MDDKKAIPTLLQFLYLGSAALAWQGASERLLRWSAAFDAWLVEREQKVSHSTVQHSLRVWRRLLAQCPKMPWELQAADIEQHTAWLKAQGYAATTISTAMTPLAAFYRWCTDHQVDPECGPEFNPLTGARPAIPPRYAGTPLLTHAEVTALLELLKRDHTPLGRRDYAFFLARLRLGALLKPLQQLRWEQIQVQESGASVRWRPDSPGTPLASDAWEAIQVYLAETGRLAQMRPQSFVFAPLACPAIGEAGRQAQDWSQERCVGGRPLLITLKRYGRLAGIPEHKLTLRALRHTATRLRLEAGDTLEQMQAFLDTRVPPALTRYQLRRLPQLPPEAEPHSQPETGEPPLPVRQAHTFEPGEGRKHGFYARSQPAQEVLAVIAEDIHGLDEAICGLRTLGRSLMEQMAHAANNAEAVRLGNAYSITAFRLASLMEAERKATAKQKKGRRQGEWGEEVLTMLCAVAEANGQPVDREDLRMQALGEESTLQVGTRTLEEEIAGLRLVLRNVLKLALEGPDGLALVEVYGHGCLRLARLLAQAENARGRLDESLAEAVEQAIREVSAELRE